MLNALVSSEQICSVCKLLKQSALIADSWKSNGKGLMAVMLGCNFYSSSVAIIIVNTEVKYDVIWKC